MGVDPPGIYPNKLYAAVPQTLETFSAKLRDETDMSTLSDELVEVIRETMRPEHVSLWLRPEAASEGHRADQQPRPHNAFRNAWQSRASHDGKAK